MKFFWNNFSEVKVRSALSSSNPSLPVQVSNCWLRYSEGIPKSWAQRQCWNVFLSVLRGWGSILNLKEIFPLFFFLGKVKLFHVFTKWRLKENSGNCKKYRRWNVHREKKSMPGQSTLKGLIDLGIWFERLNDNKNPGCEKDSILGQD